jgi:hypothetical protein
MARDTGAIRFLETAEQSADRVTDRLMRRSFQKIGMRLNLSRDASSLNGFDYAHLRVGGDDPR